MESAPALSVREGVCHAIYAFDVGREIRVESAARVLGAAQARPAAEGRPPYLHFARPPVRCTVDVGAVEVNGWFTRDAAEAVLFEFGAVAVIVDVPAHGTLADLARLGAALVGTETVERAAREAVRHLVRRLGDVVDDPHVASVVEEYLVFHVREVVSDVPVARWTEVFASDLAAVLRAETGALAAQEIAQTLAAPVSFAPDDLVLVDWNAALVARDRIDDLLSVLTFANVQLVELRFLDAQLDESLQRSYEAVRHEEPRAAVFARGLRGALERVARRQIDAALLFEHVRNAPKLLGDQYLARVYEHAARRFRLLDWNDALHRKLDVLGTIYERLRDRAAIVRAELLEWIVIVLIFVSILIPFLVPYGP